MTVRYDGGQVAAGEFQGLSCVLPDSGGVCAVAQSGDVAVMITATGTTAQDGNSLIAAVLSSAKAVES